MKRYAKMFADLNRKNQGAFIPFVMLYDPDRDTCKEILNTLVAAGADALELGIPFSDPLADGPVIQKAGLRALSNKPSVNDSFSLVAELRKENQDLPIGVLTYANLVYKNGLPWFYKQAHAAGIDSVLVADVPILEIKPYFEEAQKNDIDTILIAPSNLPKNRIGELAKYGRGYSYVQTRAGVTGADEDIKFSHQSLIKNLEAHKAPPAVFGFGISSPKHVKDAMKEGAAGVISGSKIVSIIEENLSNKNKMLSAIHAFVESMKQATNLN